MNPFKKITSIANAIFFWLLDIRAEHELNDLDLGITEKDVLLNLPSLCHLI